MICNLTDQLQSWTPVMLDVRGHSSVGQNTIMSKGILQFQLPSAVIDKLSYVLAYQVP